jgi:hypothetical protein
MARFFLHVRVQNELISDPDGDEFPSVQAAMKEAWRAARDLAAEHVRNGRSLSGREVHVWDETGRAVGTIPLLAVLKL